MHNDNEQLISLVCGENIGSTWLNLVDVVLSRGALDFDEGRERIYLRSVVIRSLTQLFPDIFLKKKLEFLKIQREQQILLKKI